VITVERVVDVPTMCRRVGRGWVRVGPWVIGNQAAWDHHKQVQRVRADWIWAFATWEVSPTLENREAMNRALNELERVTGRRSDPVTDPAMRRLGYLT